MKPFRATALLTVAALATTLTGCGDTDDEPAAPTPLAADEDAGGDDDTTATATATQTTEAGDDALPTDPPAYGDVFVQAWVDQNQDLLDQMAGADVLQGMELWNGHGWSQEEVLPEEHGATIIHYVDEQGLELELWVHEPTIVNGEPHGVTSATVSEGPYPVPSTVEDYASAFVDAAGQGDEEYLERLGTDEAVAGAEHWREFTWGVPEVTDGDDQGTAQVTFPGDDDVVLVVLVDRALAESADEDAVLEASLEAELVAP